LAEQAVQVAMAWPSPLLKFAIVAKFWTLRPTAVNRSKLKSFPVWSPNKTSPKAVQAAEAAMTAATVVAVVAHLVVAAVADLAAIAVVIVLNLVAHPALKAIVAVIASKAVAIVLKTVVHRLLALKDALKVAAISVQKLAQKAVLSHGVISAANNAVSHLAVVKPALSHVAINAPTIAAATASTHATAVPHAHQAVTMRAAVPAIVLHAAPKSWVLATSSHTMPVVMQHPSALALKC
jgi:hypothetical protein